MRELIIRRHITGDETARRYPSEDWLPIARIEEIYGLLTQQVRGESLSVSGGEEAGESGSDSSLSGRPTWANPSTAPAVDPYAPTAAMGGGVPENDSAASGNGTGSMSMPTAVSVETPAHRNPPTPQGRDAEATRVLSTMDAISIGRDSDETRVSEFAPELETPVILDRREVSSERTVMIERPQEEKAAKSKALNRILTLVVLGFGAYVAMDELDAYLNAPKKSGVPTLIRAELPVPLPEGARSDPVASKADFEKGIRPYLEDTPSGYRIAVRAFSSAAARDPANAQALALLASAYINLIDLSNKDENYFSVVTKLIDLAKAKATDIPETVMAEVEFFITVNRPEAAQERIVEYTRKRPNFALEMLYYIAYAGFARGDYQGAASYLARYPDNKASSPKLFYLRGMTAEALGAVEDAVGQYQKAIEFQPKHARSRLRIAAILMSQGKVGDAKTHIKTLVNNPSLLTPRDLAQAYFLHAQILGAAGEWELAVAELSRSIQLDREHEDYRVEYYSARAKAAEKSGIANSEETERLSRDAKLYFLIGEGHKAQRQGQYELAMSHFLQARQFGPSLPLPYVKLGDLMLKRGDLVNAKLQYKLAADRAPQSIDVWTKYISALVESYEWTEAEQAMERFRKLPVSQSAIDKAAGDIYAKQGKGTEAIALYKKAMSRESIDPTVYNAYARALGAAKHCNDALFYHSLALRYDPSSLDARTGIATCLAETQGVDRAITYLQEEAAKSVSTRVDLEAKIAEFYLQKGDGRQAERLISEAMAANPEAAAPWRVQALIHRSRESHERGALEKALSAFKSYSDRNPADPSGYFERFQILLRLARFEEAGAELLRIAELYPKYPGLFYHRGYLKSVQGNHKEAIAEFQMELKNNPASVAAMLALGKELIGLAAYKEAVEMLSRALQLAPNHGEVRHQLAWANARLKNYAGAVELFKSAAKLDSGNPMLFKRMGITMLEAGDVQGARVAFRRYLELFPDAPDRADFEKYR